LLFKIIGQLRSKGVSHRIRHISSNLGTELVIIALLKFMGIAFLIRIMFSISAFTPLLNRYLSAFRSV